MKFYNTLSKKKEEFFPRGNIIKIYSCGPTVYNFIHIGNARPLCVFDVFRRYFLHTGYQVKFVQNFTDIDDKIIERAHKENTDCVNISERFIEEYKTDAKGLDIIPADVHPKATEVIDEIIKMILNLIEKKHAYVVNSGDVYFNTESFENYGKLSGQSLKDLKSGARVEPSEEKRSPLDFALWKHSKKGEPYWESPWGCGRPGWHIECSAMANKYLGETIDIHCGGQDLIFPHHENEITQSECANGVKFAEFWLHNGFININSQKMSKSLNNFFTVREVALKHSYEAIRYFMISAHYRSPLNFSEEIICQCKNSVLKLRGFRNNLEFINFNQTSENGQNIIDNLETYKIKFLEFMNDDLNTPGALSIIFDLIKEANIKISKSTEFCRVSVQKTINLFDDLTFILGILQSKESKEFSGKIKKLINERNTAREHKNWARADEIREILKKKGVILEDTHAGSRIVT